MVEIYAMEEWLQNLEYFHFQLEILEKDEASEYVQSPLKCWR
jgi:hypothetical protein